MTETAKALSAFWNSFGIPAYPENDVPSEPDDKSPIKPPYITYQLMEPESLENSPYYARVWYRTESFVTINSKLDEITARIDAGIILPTSDGALCIYKANPFIQYQPLEGTAIKCAYLNMQINNYQ